MNQQAICSCLPNYVGSPPGCRPECVVSSECPSNKACINNKCSDPCQGTCGLNTRCSVINHSPICSCTSGYTGDPFTRCYPIPRKQQSKLIMMIDTKKFLVAPPPQPVQVEHVNPCVPSPCGANSECRNVGNVPSCICLPTFIGSPPNCRPECSVNSDCSSNLACIRDKCRDPCPGSCGISATCNVQNHIPICSCLDGYTGDPFTNCVLSPPKSKYNYDAIYSFIVK